MLKSVELFGLTIVASREEEFWLELRSELQKNRSKGNKRVKLLMTPNPEQIVMAEKNLELRRNLEQADFLIPDGAGLVWASKYFFNLKLRSEKCAERIAGSDVVARLISWSEKEKLRILVIGGFYQEMAIEKDKESGVSLIETAEGSKIGWLGGYEQVTQPTGEEEAQVKKALRVWQPDIVLVAFGAPCQEEWLVKHKKIMTEVGTRLGMAVGGSVDFLTGKTTRAPVVLREHGLEWMFRLVRQPWRWRRQLALGKFLGLVADEANRELKTRKLN